MSPGDVFHDLCKVMIELDDSSTPTELGMKLRDDAVAFVKEGKETGKWSTWADAHLLIEDQDGAEEAFAEGLEAFGAVAADTDDEKTESLDEDDEDDAAAESGGSQPSDPTGSQPSVDAPALAAAPDLFFGHGRCC